MPTVTTPLPSTAQVRADLARDLRRAARVLFGTLALLWGFLLVDTLLGGRLDALGLYPRTIFGLRGLLFAPLLHGGVMHLLGNSIGIVTLGGLVLAREERYFWGVTAMGALLGGLGVWAFGRSAIHIGASGVIFAYLGYLLAVGFIERRIGSIVLSAFVGAVYGGVLLGMLPGQPGVSWEGHLFGFLSGILAARVLAPRRRA